MKPKPGYYKHYKGATYKFLMLARDSDDLKELVVYQGQYTNEFGTNPVWVRPVAEFMETIERDGKTMPRFEYLGEEL